MAGVSNAGNGLDLATSAVFAGVIVAGMANGSVNWPAVVVTEGDSKAFVT